MVRQQKEYKVTTYHVWYMRPDFFRDGIMGYDWLAEKKMLPDPCGLTATHIHLKDTEAKSLEALWMHQQGEIWSPNGEARPLIKQKGLQHTSMSVGDIAVVDGEAWMADNFGFKKLGGGNGGDE